MTDEPVAAERPRPADVPSPASTRAAGADRRSRQTRGQVRRDRIIAAAVGLLASKGFRGTSIAELAARVGMTHPGLLYYFGSKERLLIEVVNERERMEGAAIYDADPGNASLADLTEVSRLIAESAVFTRLYVVLAAENLDDGDPLHDFFVDRYERARKMVALAARADIDRGTIRPDVDIPQLAREVVATLMGLEIQWLMDPARIDYLDTAGTYTTDLLERLSPR